MQQCTHLLNCTRNGCTGGKHAQGVLVLESHNLCLKWWRFLTVILTRAAKECTHQPHWWKMQYQLCIWNIQKIGRNSDSGPTCTRVQQPLAAKTLVCSPKADNSTQSSSHVGVYSSFVLKPCSTAHARDRGWRKNTHGNNTQHTPSGSSGLCWYWARDVLDIRVLLPLDIWLPPLVLQPSKLYKLSLFTVEWKDPLLWSGEKNVKILVSWSCGWIYCFCT